MFKNLFSTEGRIGRLQYFLTYFSLLLIGLFLLYAYASLGVRENIPLTILSILILGVLFWIFIAQGIRRGHDLGWSGPTIIILAFLVGVNAILLFIEGQRQDNEYGETLYLKNESNLQKWTKFVFVLAFYLLFLFWLKSWLGLIVIPFIYDAYITKKINWQWWKDAESPVRFIMSWVDALVFALVAVYFINLFFFQNYVIPSSSLEKSLLTGDYLFVSKASYGPRIPQTPLTMPLTQHTMPMLGCKSYIEWPQWDYRRAPGLGKVELNDIVVFNYPAGDSIMSEEAYQTNYYEFCYKYGALAYLASKGYEISNPEQMIYYPDFYSTFEKSAKLDSISDLERYKLYSEIYQNGRSYIASKVNQFGRIDSRPTDRRENYVKRCVGLPGQTLQIKNHIIYLDGKPNKEPENVQYSYAVKLNVSFIPDELLKELGISNEDLAQLSRAGYMPLTKHAYEVLKSRKDLVAAIAPYTEDKRDFIYPLNGHYGWTRDNYGPIWIPKKGESVKLTLKNLPIYERPIKVYEGNDLQVNDKGQILINGKVATSYTFKLDYYWMQGDNRHNSADSRYWGFVPEDHIVGKPIFIWWSSDPDRRGFGGIRWSRLFTFVENYN